MLIRCPECGHLAPATHYRTCDNGPMPTPVAGRRSSYLRIRPRWGAIIASAFTGVALGGIAVASLMIATDTDTEPVVQEPIPACVTEDSTNCYWDAETRGTGEGRSFVDVAGTAYYVDTASEDAACAAAAITFLEATHAAYATTLQDYSHGVAWDITRVTEQIASTSDAEAAYWQYCKG